MSFEKTLQQGKVGESWIATWLRGKGHHVLPVYEIEKGQYKGPAVYSACGEQIIAPDMLVFGKGKIIWIEAKHKNAVTWHRKSGRFVTGIDLHHYRQYQKIMTLVDWPVWLLFLHQGGQAKDSLPSPSGLFGNELDYLTKHVNHRHSNHGKSGMVYWAINHLQKLADYRRQEGGR